MTLPDTSQLSDALLTAEASGWRLVVARRTPHGVELVFERAAGP